MISYQLSLYYYACILFACDLIFFALTSQQLVQALSCGCIIALLLDKHRSLMPFMITMSLYDMLISGRFGFSLITLLPLVYMRPDLQKHLTTEATRTPVILWSIQYIVNLILLRIVIQEQSFDLIYTILQYCSNLIVLLGCLTIYRKGWLGNRF